MKASHESATVSGTTPEERGRSQRRGHGWMMIACCIPMLVVAVVLLAAGVVSPGFLFLVAAIGCTVIMAVMMATMGNGSDHRA